MTGTVRDEANYQAVLAAMVRDEQASPAAAGLSIAQCADEALELFKQLAGVPLLAGVRGSSLLTERSAFMPLANPATTSANGSCKLLPSSSGLIAINLAREEDWSLLAAWLQTEHAISHWDTVKALVAARDSAELVARARLLGLPVAPVNAVQGDHCYGIRARGDSCAHSGGSPLIVDLSALWAGPLCTHLLQLAGARVIKVESRSRPDSTRYSTPALHQLLNGGKRSVVVDLGLPAELAKLKTLIESADIVVESSRPRALLQLGIDAEAMVRAKPGLVWLSITGYGRTQPQANWVAFGDDAAAAGGLLSEQGEQLHFVGDAIADPLTGLHAAIIVLDRWRRGQACLVDIALSTVAAFVRRHCEEIEPLAAATLERRKNPQPAPDLGSDTHIYIGGGQ